MFSRTAIRHNIQTATITRIDRSPVNIPSPNRKNIVKFLRSLTQNRHHTAVVTRRHYQHYPILPRIFDRTSFCWSQLIARRHTPVSILLSQIQTEIRDRIFLSRSLRSIHKLYQRISPSPRIDRPSHPLRRSLINCIHNPQHKSTVLATFPRLQQRIIIPAHIIAALLNIRVIQIRTIRTHTSINTPHQRLISQRKIEQLTDCIRIVRIRRMRIDRN